MKHHTSINIRTSMVNEWDHFTIHGYEDLFMQVLEDHLYELSTPKMKQDHISWVLLSMAIEVNHYIHRGEHLEADIFDTEIIGPVIRKDIGFYRDGTLVITAVAYMALMDLDARKIYKGDMQDYCDTFCFREKLMEANSRISVDLDLAEANLHEVQVQASCIDALGHCNNERYFAMIYNTMDEQHQSMYGFHRLEISFLREVRKHERLKVYGTTQGDTFVVRGIREDGITSFMARLTYDKTPE